MVSATLLATCIAGRVTVARFLLLTRMNFSLGAIILMTLEL
jgi:hypothetical protein